ncbi:MAG: sigma-70 family RNA polymerase sigma factor [Planctomycetota bacterium]
MALNEDEAHDHDRMIGRNGRGKNRIEQPADDGGVRDRRNGRDREAPKADRQKRNGRARRKDERNGRTAGPEGRGTKAGDAGLQEELDALADLDEHALIDLDDLEGDAAAPEDLSSEQLFKLFQDTGDTAWRDALVERHLPQVLELARALQVRLPRSVHLEDLCNAGYWGLLRSLETYDPEKGGFRVYLRIRVQGAMVDELRAMDWLPKLLRARIEHRNRVSERLRSELGREPTENELATELDVDLDRYRRSYPKEAPTVAWNILEGEDREQGGPDGKIVSLGLRGREAHGDDHPLNPMYRRELIARIQDLCTETEWSLVELHYFRGLKLREVAEELHLSPARICQIHGRVLQRLKERLREESHSI